MFLVFLVVSGKVGTEKWLMPPDPYEWIPVSLSWICHTSSQAQQLSARFPKSADHERVWAYMDSSSISKVLEYAEAEGDPGKVHAV